MFLILTFCNTYLHSPAYGQCSERFLSLVGRSGNAGL